MSKSMRVSVDGVVIEGRCELSHTLENFLKLEGMAVPAYLRPSSDLLISTQWELAHRWNGAELSSVAEADIPPSVPALGSSELSASLGV